MKSALSSPWLALAACLASSLGWSAEVVYINTADAVTLARDLKGVGDTRARAIVAHRAEHGPFKSADELTLVKGIGPRVVEQNRTVIRVDRVSRATPSGAVPAMLSAPATQLRSRLPAGPAAAPARPASAAGVRPRAGG